MSILICDSQPIFAQGLVQLLSQEAPEFEVRGLASSPAELQDMARRVGPDLVMLDARFGLEPVRLLRSTLPHVKVVLIATSDQETDLGETVRAGVVAYLLKEERISDLVQAIRLVLRGQLVAPAALARRAFRPTRQGLTALDDQERRILARIAQGATNRDIARELSLSERTVRRRVVQIYATLQVSDRFDAALFAARHNLVEPDQTPGGDAHG